MEEDWFNSAPAALRSALSSFLGVPPGEVVLGDSTSWGLHLLAWSYPWRSGDEVLTVSGDFPASHLPWTTLAESGVWVREVAGARGGFPDPAELDAAITPRTRFFCASWVSSFTGDVLDVVALAEVLRAKGVAFVLNASQALGVLSQAPATLGVDAVVGCGWKWLCGPYGTGYAWFTPELLDRLDPPLRYWRTEVGLTAVIRAAPGAVTPGPLRDSRRQLRRLDVFAAANFFNVLPWTAALEVLSNLGRNRIEARARGLADRLLRGVDEGTWFTPGRHVGPAASPIVVLAPRSSHDPGAVAEGARVRLLAGGIHASVRAGRLRFSPHVYNDEEQIDRALEILKEEKGLASR